MSTTSGSGADGRSAAAGSDGEASGADDEIRWQECLEAALQYFHEKVDRQIQDHTADGSHPERATTAREYFHNRGWEDGVISDRQLGWSPPDSDNELKDHLTEIGYTEQELLATGLFTEDLNPLWKGRYVFPYFDEDGASAYAISRSTGSEGGGKVGYDGHPADFIKGKYGRLAHTKEYARVSEPIFGQGSVRDGDPVIITEGVADAITVQQVGYASISPVTTQFSRDQQANVLTLLDEHAVPEVYVLQDAERPTVACDDAGELDIEQFGPGIKGAIETATFLTENGVDARVNTPPRVGLRKVDVDDYLRDGWGSLGALLRSAKPPTQHPAYTESNNSDRSVAPSDLELSSVPPTTDAQSSLFSLDITDVAGISTDYRGKNPLGHTGDSEDYFVVINSDWTYDHKRQAGYNPLTYLLCDAGERSVATPNGSLSEKEYFVAWKHAKEIGVLPESDPIPHTALIHIVLEHDLCERAAIQDGWKIPRGAYNTALEILRDQYGLKPGRDPYGTANNVNNLSRTPSLTYEQSEGSSLTIDEARDRCQATIDQALAQTKYSLIDALPAQGKSRGVIEWAARNDTPLTVLAPRRDLLNDEYEEWCDELGLDYYDLPALQRDCPSAMGEHGKVWEDRIKKLYEAGATAGEIHGLAKVRYGSVPPCHQDGTCTYLRKWDFDPEKFDVLLGHYTHAYRDDIIDGRVVAIDETPTGAFVKEFDHDTVAAAVSYFLEQHDGLPFDSYADLTERRTDRYRAGDARKWFRQNESEIKRDGYPVVVSDTGNANAFGSLLTYTLLTGDDLGNGWEYASLPGGRVGIRNRTVSSEYNEAEVHLLVPPSFEDAERVIALDGTPWAKQWELCLGHPLTHYKVLNRDERATYLQDALGLAIYQMSEAAKPYSSGTWVKSKQLKDDAALFEYVGEQNRRLPGLITSKTAKSKYEEAGMLELVENAEYYGNIKGSNTFKNKHLGVVTGSPHYGDTHIEKWGALAGEAIERVSDDGGMDLDYGSFGNDILQDMRENEVLQAVMRFGRDGNSTAVYVSTAALPGWVPVAANGEIKKWSDGMEQVLDAVGDRDEWRTSDLFTDTGDQSTLETTAADSISKRQVRRNLTKLYELGFLNQYEESGGWVWEDMALGDVSTDRQVLFAE
jgi:hypothetical protein